MQKDILQIDIDSVFQKKNPKIYKWIPRFVLSWIKHILHQKEINDVLRETANLNLNDADFAEYVIKNKLNSKTEVMGMEHVPKQGGVILVSNHPLGGMDGMVILQELSKVRNDIKVIVNDILSEIPNFKDSFLYVNKLGNKAKQSLAKIEASYANGDAMVVFPAGLCSRKINGSIQDLEWQKSFVSRAKKYNLPVVPMYFDGKNSNRFYNIANWRKRLGIKTNIEMFFLVDELYRQKNSEFKLFIGKPIPPEIWSKPELGTDSEKAQWARKFIVTLKDNLESDFMGFVENHKSYNQKT